MLMKTKSTDKTNAYIEEKITHLEQVNAILHSDIERLNSAYTKLLNVYISDLFDNNGEKIPDIRWNFTTHDIVNSVPLKGTCNEDRIYCTPTESGYDVTIEKVVVTKLNNRNSEILPPINSVLPPIPDVDMSDTDFEVCVDFEKAKMLIEEHLKKAKESGATEMYINKGGEILYPYNLVGNVKARISDDRLLSLDEFDDLVEFLCDTYKTIEVMEDINLMVFHFGGDYVEQ